LANSCRKIEKNSTKIILIRFFYFIAKGYVVGLDPAALESMTITQTETLAQGSIAVSYKQCSTQKKCRGDPKNIRISPSVFESVVQQIFCCVLQQNDYVIICCVNTVEKLLLYTTEYSVVQHNRIIGTITFATFVSINILP
jgi:hypothetical protein